MLNAETWEFIDEQAAALGVEYQARQKWKQRGWVPHKWRLPLLEKAAAEKFELNPNDFEWQVPAPAE